MLFKSEKCWFLDRKFILALSLGLSLLSLWAQAAVSISAINGVVVGPGVGSTTNSVYYTVVASPVPAPFLDNNNGEGITFISPDLTATDAGDSNPGNNVLLFNVATDKTATAGQVLYLVITAAVSGGPTLNVPIYSVGSATNPCSSGGCWANAGSVGIAAASFYNAVQYSAPGTIIGLHPKSICSNYALISSSPSLSGCSGSNVTPPTTGATSSTSGPSIMQLSFNILSATPPPTGTTGWLPANAQGEAFADTAQLNLIFQADVAGFNCPASLQKLYFPGDSSILLNTSLFLNSLTTATMANRAPLNEILVVGVDDGTTTSGGAGPVTDPTSSKFAPFSRGVGLPATQLVKGFTNTTAPGGLDHNYWISFLLRDASGVLATPPPSCFPIGPVQTSAVNGFLNKDSCFISNAVYGSHDATPVVLLREFRDAILIKSELGRSFVRWYYDWSPGSARWLRSHPVFRLPVMIGLVPVEVVAWLALHFNLLLVLSVFGLGFGCFRYRKYFGFFFILLLLTSSDALKAAEQSVQPYIEQLKQKMENQGAPDSSSENYTESIKAKLPPENRENANESYIDEIKRKNPERFAPSMINSSGSPGGLDEKSFIEKKRAELGPKDSGGAIQAVLEGHSELHEKREGKIHHVFGVRVGASMVRNIANLAGTSDFPTFDNMYGTDLNPDVTFFYEYQPFHSEIFGNIGLMLSGGIVYNVGYGRFAVQLYDAVTGYPFPLTSQTMFQFFTLPVTAAAIYRFNLPWLLRPYIVAGPSAIPFIETRNDASTGHRGISYALNVSLGVAVYLDWLNKSSAWDLYTEHGIQHTYLTVEYNRLASVAGEVSFESSGIMAGVAFEF